jgi:GAF domain-containing protein
MIEKNRLMELDALLEDERDPIVIMANAAAWLFYALDDINWLGFYRYKDGELVLGPFQGKVACTRIAVGRGVCGAAFSANAVLRVDNVEEFPGHIACDADSRSEIVLPLVGKSGTPLGVLDIDSASYGRFSAEDEAALTLLAARIAKALDEVNA